MSEKYVKGNFVVSHLRVSNFLLFNFFFEIQRKYMFLKINKGAILQYDSSEEILLTMSNLNNILK